MKDREWQYYSTAPIVLKFFSMAFQVTIKRLLHVASLKNAILKRRDRIHSNISYQNFSLLILKKPKCVQIESQVPEEWHISSIKLFLLCFKPNPLWESGFELQVFIWFLCLVFHMISMICVEVCFCFDFNKQAWEVNSNENRSVPQNFLYQSQWRRNTGYGESMPKKSPQFALLKQPSRTICSSYVTVTS